MWLIITNKIKLIFAIAYKIIINIAVAIFVLKDRFNYNNAQLSMIDLYFKLLFNIFNI